MHPSTLPNAHIDSLPTAPIDSLLTAPMDSSRSFLGASLRQHSSPAAAAPHPMFTLAGGGALPGRDAFGRDEWQRRPAGARGGGDSGSGGGCGSAGGSMDSLERVFNASDAAYAEQLALHDAE
eukprot:141508-Chlamydomonas_euryale.AAC.1